MSKRMLLFGSIGLVLVLAVVGFVMIRRSSGTPTEEPTSNKKRIVEPVNVIPATERPYLSLLPLADGRNIKILVSALQKPATEVEYELEYQAGTLLQGAFGSFDINSLPSSEQILLGSCSAGGACTYHQDVKGGSLLTRFVGPENYSLKTEWKYIDNSSKEKEHSSKDGKFQIVSDALARVRYIVISQSSGVPSGYKGSLASEPYALATSSSVSGTAELTIRAQEEGELSIIGWDGSSWQTFDSTQDGKMVTASVDLLDLYVVVSQ